MISGASIAIAALLLIVPGFFTDAVGFILLFPVTRKIVVRFLIKKRKIKETKENNNTIDAEIVEDKKDGL